MRKGPSLFALERQEVFCFFELKKLSLSYYFLYTLLKHKVSQNFLRYPNSSW